MRVSQHPVSGSELYPVPCPGTQSPSVVLEPKLRAEAASAAKQAAKDLVFLHGTRVCVGPFSTNVANVANDVNVVNDTNDADVK